MSDDVFDDEEEEEEAVASGLMEALAQGDSRRIRWILSNSHQWVCSEAALSNDPKTNPVLAAVAMGDADCVREFLDGSDCAKWRFGSERGSDSWFGLGAVAAAYGTIHLFEMLADAGADLMDSGAGFGKTPMTILLDRGDAEGVERLTNALESSVPGKSLGTADRMGPLASGVGSWVDREAAGDAEGAARVLAATRRAVELGWPFDGRGRDGMSSCGLSALVYYSDGKDPSGELAKKAVEISLGLGAGADSFGWLGDLGFERTAGSVAVAQGNSWLWKEAGRFGTGEVEALGLSAACWRKVLAGDDWRYSLAARGSMSEMLADMAQRLGAVDAVWREDGRLEWNSDAMELAVDAFERNGAPKPGRRRILSA